MVHHETIGDVRDEVNAVFEPENLRVSGGSYYPHTRGAAFELVDHRNNRAGDAYCLLPDCGWTRNTYNPNLVGEPTDERDRLRLTAAKGLGKLIAPEIDLGIEEGYEVDLTPTALGVTYHLINNSDTFLVVRSRSTRYPGNLTDINSFGNNEIDPSANLYLEEFFSHSATFGRAIDPAD